MKASNVIYAVPILWCAFAIICAALPHHTMFEVLDALAIAAGVVVMLAYAPAMADAWRNRFERLTPAHILSLGIISNWLGFTIRLGRWYVTDIEPVEVGNAAQWSYNVGLWITVMAAFFLVWALAAADKNWSRTRTIAYWLLFFGLSAALWLLDYFTS